MNIALISGSARPKRQSHKVTMALQDKLATQQQVTVNLLDVKEPALPLLDQVFSTITAPSQQLVHWHETLDNAEAVIIVSPEHNGSFSGALKNAMDYFYEEYAGKPLGIITVSAGALGGINAAKALQLYGIKLGMILYPDFLITPKVQSVFGEGHEIADESYAKRLDKFIDGFLAFSTKHKK